MPLYVNKLERYGEVREVPSVCIDSLSMIFVSRECGEI